MSEVCFSKNIEKIIESIDFSKLGKKVAIKTHFGEKGNTTYVDPQIVRKVYKKIERLGKDVALVECNVLYKGSRTNSTDHIETAQEHGFTEMNIDILDGEKGDEFLEINRCKIGEGIGKYDSLVVISHFKGHRAAGFGGAIKNVGMGFGSRAGKLDMHSNTKPSISSDCIGCGLCVEYCNADAISIDEKKAFITKDICEGCAMCISICPSGAVQIPWGSRNAEEMQKRIAQYSSAVLSRFSNPIFINVLEKITKLCDCMGIKQKPFMQDVGILHSSDIVAIDKASLDLADKFSNGRFKKINSIDKEKQIEETELLEIGESEYNLIDIG